MDIIMVLAVREWRRVIGRRRRLGGGEEERNSAGLLTRDSTMFIHIRFIIQKTPPRSEGCTRC